MMVTKDALEFGLSEIRDEVKRAMGLHDPINSAHEAWAVIFEELQEFWDWCRRKREERDRKAMAKELVQTAAMCMRALIELELAEELLPERTKIPGRPIDLTPEPEPEPAPDPLADEIAKAMDLASWSEERGFGSDQGAKCPHCGLIVPPAELVGIKGELPCPACRRGFRWTVMEVGGKRCWSTLAPAK